MRLSLAVGLVFCGLSGLGTAWAGLQFYVATNGTDTATGGLSAPFRTLERARDEIRHLKAAGEMPADGAVVTVRRGVYELARPLEFSTPDSGTPDGLIIYRKEAEAEVRISGGRILTGWTLVRDSATLEKMDRVARGKVWACDLRALGITNLPTPKTRPSWGHSEAGQELFFNDEPMTVARWPNQGYARIDEVLGPTVRTEGGEKGVVEGIFSVRTDRMKRWVGEPHVMVHGYWFFDWADERQRVESLDAAKGIITLARPYHSYGYRKGQWFYAYDLLSERDQPGEWYLDRASSVLYFWPPARLDRGKARLSLLPRLVRFEGASHVTFEGMVFECGSGIATEPAGIRTAAVAISGGTNVTLAGCVVRNCGSWAVMIEHGERHRVVSSDIFQMGEGGVWLEGGDRQTLAPGENVVDNCHIHHFSRWNRVYNPAIRLRGVGNRASHNLIHDGPHMGIDFGGNDHVIEFNEIHDVVRESNDAGTVYTGRDWSMRGHQIRFNYLHDIFGRDKRGCQGVYLDDCFSSATIFGNVFYRVPEAAFIGGGRDCVIANNIFVDCAPAVHVDARGLSWNASWQTELTNKLEQMPYRSDPWSARYPQLLSLLADQPWAPKGNIIATNVCWGGQWADVEKAAEPFLVITNNLVQIDPKFVRSGSAVRRARPEEKGIGASHPRIARFQLRPDSPAWKLGFQPIPIEKIGLYDDPHRSRR